MASASCGARNSGRVKQAIKHVLIAVTTVMAVATIVTQWRPELLLRGFTEDEATIADGALFLKMVSLNLVAQGVIFVCSSTF
jgi:Na+-driven multidrug efflux pump